MTKQTSDIKAAIQSLELTFARSNAADIADFYTDNGMLLPTGFDFIIGKRDIQFFWQAALDMGIKNLKLDVLEIEKHGDTVIEISKYIMSGSNDQVLERGKGIVIWKYENNSWKIHRDIWNSSELDNSSGRSL